MSLALTVVLLTAASAVMYFAWYHHLKDKNTTIGHLPWLILISWLPALIEYALMVPATRIGTFSAGLSLPQLRILQEVIALAVFVPFAIFVFGVSFHWDHAFAFLCLLGAVYFMFRRGFGV